MSSPANSDQSASPPQPYPGLRPFTRDEGMLFFGRAAQVSRMLERLEEQHFLAVVGGSGSGKSSLVRAGLLPALGQGYLFDSGTDWKYIVAKPGNDPFGNLARVFCAELSDGESSPPDQGQIAFAEATFRSSPRGFIDAVADAGLPEGKSVLLVIDQFEEIFRFRNERAKRSDVHEARNTAAAFVNLLLETGLQSELPIYVIITMRSDFIGDCDALSGLPEAISNHQFLVPRLTREQIRAAIEKPLKLFGARAQPQLVSQILNDVGTDPDQLPLMQHALMRTWFSATKEAGEEEPIVLELDHYEKVGGVSGTLTKHAEEAWDSLDDKDQQLARTLFLCVSTRQSNGQLTRRPAGVSEVAAVAGVQASALYPVIRAFQKANRNFIFHSPPGDLEPGSMLDISHESLLRQWPRVRDWLGEESDSVAEYHRLADNARRQSELLRGRDLDRALKWKKQQQPTEVWAQRYDIRAEEDSFSGALEYLERSRFRAALRTWMFTIAALAVAVFLIVSGVVALKKVREAKENARLAEERAVSEKAERLLVAIARSDELPTREEIDGVWELAQLAPEDEEVRLKYLQLALNSTELESLRRESSEEQINRIIRELQQIDAKEAGDKKRHKAELDAGLVEPGSKSLSSYDAAIGSLERARGELKKGSSDPIKGLEARLAVSVYANARLDPGLHGKLFEIALATVIDSGKTLAQRKLAAEIIDGLHLTDQSMRSQAAEAFLDFRDSVSNSTSLEDTLRLEELLPRMLDGISPKAAEVIATKIFKSLDDNRPEGPSSRAVPTKLLKVLAANLSPTSIDKFTKKAVANMRDQEEAGQKLWWTEALGAFADHINKDVATEGGRILIDLVEAGSLQDIQVVTAAASLTKLQEKLPPEMMLEAASMLPLAIGFAPAAQHLDFVSASRAAETIVAAMRVEQTGDVFRFGESLKAFAPLLSPEQAAEAVRLMLKALIVTHENYTDEFFSGFGPLHEFGENLAPEASAAVGGVFVEEILGTDSLAPITACVQAIGGSNKHLSESQIREVAEHILGAMSASPRPTLRELSSFGRSLGSLGERVPTAVANAASALLLAAIEEPPADRLEPDKIGIAAAGVALGQLPVELPDQTALQASQMMLDLLFSEEIPSIQEDLGSAWFSLASQLPPAAALSIAEKGYPPSTNANSIRTWRSGCGKVLGAMSYSEPEAVKAVGFLETWLKSETNFEIVSELGGDLSAVAPQMTAGSQKALAGRLITWMNRQNSVAARFAAADALCSMAKNLDVPHLKLAIDAVLVALSGSPEGHSAEAALAPLLEPLDDRKDLLEILRHPFCVGGARRLVLNKIVSPGTAETGPPDLRDLIRWAAENEIDLNATPVRPE